MSLYDFQPGKPKPAQKPPQKRAGTTARNTPARSTTPAIKGTPATKPSPTKRAVSSQAERLKITVQRPDQLDALAQKLGLSKAGVFNLALVELAARYNLR